MECFQIPDIEIVHITSGHITLASFRAPTPQQEISRKVVILYSHGKEMVWEAQSMISVHTERDISMQLGFICSHVIPEAPNSLVWRNNLRRGALQPCQQEVTNLRGISLLKSSSQSSYFKDREEMCRQECVLTSRDGVRGGSALQTCHFNCIIQ